MARPRTAAWLIGALLWSASAKADTPPTIDCALGYEGLRAAAQSLPGGAWSHDNGYDVVAFEEPDAWKARIAFTSPGHPAHPAVTLRTLRKQVTEVWTSESKGCGYGNRVAFDTLMADMKAGDTAFTNASRQEVERRKQEQSPLAP